MWPFTGRKRERYVDPDIIDRLDALEARIEKIDIEWSEWFDKFRRLYARLAKRVHDDEVREKGPVEPSNSPAGVINGHRTINPLAAALLRGSRPDT